MNFELLSAIFIELESVDLLTLLSISPDALDLAADNYRQRVKYRQLHPECWIAPADPLELGLTLEFIQYITPTTQLEWILYNLIVDPVEEDIIELCKIDVHNSTDFRSIAEKFELLYPKLILFREFLQDRIDELCLKLFAVYNKCRFTNIPLLKCLRITTVSVVDKMKEFEGDYDYVPLITKLFHDLGPFPKTHVQRYLEIFPDHNRTLFYDLGRMVKDRTLERDQTEQCTLFEEYFRQHPKLTDEYRRQFYTDLGRMIQNDSGCNLTDKMARSILDRFDDSVYTYQEYANFRNLHWICFEYWWIHGYMPRYQQLKAAGKSVKLMIPREKDIKWSLNNFGGRIWITLYLTQLLPKPITVEIPSNINVITAQLLTQTRKIKIKRH